MKKALFCVLLVLLASLWQCNFPSPLGEDIVQNEILDVVFIDTVTLKLSTAITDSLVTSNLNRHLVGHQNNREVGRISASPFFQINGDTIVFPEEGAEYLSAEFELFYDGYFYYDTAREVSLSLYHLSEELALEEEENVLYNTSRFAYAPDSALGTLTFEPRPGRGGSISIPIEESYGRTMFDFTNIDEQELFFDEFYDRYPGFVLVADTADTQSFLGFTPGSRLVIHYRDEGEDYELRFPSNLLRFNQIISDRTGTPLENLLTSEEDISSSITNHRAYLSNGIGTAIKVEIPSLREIREVLTRNFITEATLVLRPIKGTYDKLTPFPGEINVFEVDRFNRIQRPLAVPQSLVVDEEFGEGTEYRINLTDFVQNKIEENDLAEDAILLRGSETALGTTVDRLVVGDRTHEFEASLELFVLDYIIDNE